MAAEAVADTDVRAGEQMNGTGAEGTHSGTGVADSREAIHHMDVLQEGGIDRQPTGRVALKANGVLSTPFNPPKPGEGSLFRPELLEAAEPEEWEPTQR